MLPKVEGDSLAGSLHVINEYIEEVLMVLLLTVISIMLAVDILLRNLTSISLPGGRQFVLYIFVLLSWVGASYAVKLRIHLRMDLVQSKLPDRLRFGVLILSNVMFVVVMALIAYYSIQITQTQRQFGRTITGVDWFQIYWFYGTLPLVSMIVIVRLVQNIWEDIRVYRESGEFVEGTALFQFAEVEDQ